MSPARIRGVSEYSFEADMWSLGVTMIAIMTGDIPFPTANGSWQLMKAILEGPQPTLSKEGVSSEMYDFIHQCLNQPFGEKSSALILLDHPFLSLARGRGILPMHKPANLARCGKLMPTSTSIKKVVEVAIAWQLEELNNEIKNEKFVIAEAKKSTRKFPRFSTPQIQHLAFQMGAESSVLEDKYVIYLTFTEFFINLMY
jgi:serine/threonine protein kinase